MTARVRMLVQIALDSVSAAAMIWVVLYVFSETTPSGSLFAIALIYALAIAAPAHAILGFLFPMSSGGPVVQWSIFVATLTGIAVVGSAIGTLIVVGLQLETRAPFTVLLGRSMRLAIVLALLIGVVQAMLQRLKDRLDAAETRLHEQALEHERALTLATEARLAALEARVHPHFLFNSLNTVTSLIPDAPDRAERLVEQIAAVLRFSLDAHHGGRVGMHQEMKIVRDYLEIERARFGERLRYLLDVDTSLDTVLVPPFAIQTLVENSVKHAIGHARVGGEVQVRARRDADHVWIEVSDTGPGFCKADIPAGHGLDNLCARLALTCGATQPLSLERRDGWFTVTLQVPV